MLTSMHISAGSSKTICIYVLIYLERIIQRTQHLKADAFDSKKKREDNFAFDVSPMFEVKSRGTPISRVNGEMTASEMHELLQNTDFKPTIPQFQVNNANWRSIIYACTLVATKFWEDKYFWNIDVVRKLKIFDLKYTNKYENLIIGLTDFELAVEKETFDSYYNWLRVYKFYKESSGELVNLK